MDVEVADMARFPAPPSLDALRTMPLPAVGHTAERFRTLAEIAAVDLSIGRLVEGHVDAIAILAEAGVEGLDVEAPLGVWAAGTACVSASAYEGGWALSGLKPWCSGASSIHQALVTAAAPDGARLFIVDVRVPGVRPDPSSWPSVGMRGSDTLDVALDVQVGETAAIAGPGWYTERPGFWFGSVGVAACWLGGAIGAVRSAAGCVRHSHGDPHQLAALGAAAARCDVLAAAIERAGDWIDGHSADPARQARTLAFGVRQAVEEGCLAVAADVGRAAGASHLTHDADQARRIADLPVYIRQHHGGRDAATYACALLESGLGTR
jgi:alkylation response protein AidB-like acyl-CoA dehydrogenase